MKFCWNASRHATSVWEERKVPKECMDAVIIPIPKMGNWSSCDNWWGIALLEVVGKVAARVIQGRLQRLAERELPDSQCGFRNSRSCTDMTLVVRQLTEQCVCVVRVVCVCVCVCVCVRVCVGCVCVWGCGVCGGVQCVGVWVWGGYGCMWGVCVCVGGGGVCWGGGGVCVLYTYMYKL